MQNALTRVPALCYVCWNHCILTESEPQDAGGLHFVPWESSVSHGNPQAEQCVDGHTSFLVFLVCEITNKGIMGRWQAPAFLVPPQTLQWHLKPYVGTMTQPVHWCGCLLGFPLWWWSLSPWHVMSCHHERSILERKGLIWLHHWRRAGQELRLGKDLEAGDDAETIWGEPCRYPSREVNYGEMRMKTSVKIDIVSLNQDFRESDIRQFIPNKFRHSINWKISFPGIYSTISGAQGSIVT